MISSRGLHVIRPVVNNFLLVRNGRNNLNKQIVRNCVQYLYRKAPSSFSKKDLLLCDVCGTLFWWYIFYNIFVNYDEFMGVKFPDTSKWTDKELGIPPLED